jgi:Arc/MetJ-type ribon-helix-helix transcriptional regulator
MRSPVYTAPFTLFMPQELLSRLKDAAAHDYKTQSEFVRETIREKIEREREAVPVPTLLVPQGVKEITDL